MIALDKTYQKEPIPGIVAIVAKRVLRRTADMMDTKNPPFGRDGRVHVLATFDEWEPDRVYSACPFKDVLDAYPGPQDITKLWDYQKMLAEHMDNQEELNAWANNIITIITRELWPDPKKWWNQGDSE